ncbi:MAG TPA: hypothetical protein VN901_14435 [Candidatus Acidoferrales bacterium]|nr:hypothetical protein [Candidatus Acidoferrales bacterium]
MRTNESWEEQQRAIDAARVLAEFANLKPDGVEGFRTAHRDFVPAGWWDYRPTSFNGVPAPTMQWQINQKLLRDAWLFEFDMELNRYVQLLTSVFDPNDPEPSLFERHHRPAFVTGLDIGYELQDQLPYYRAVKWLGGQGWRAKTCLFCGKRFVAEHPKTKFCSFDVTVDKTNFSIAAEGIKMSCFWAYRNGRKHVWWIEHRERINERRRREYRLEKKGSRRAKR